jgi:hypothetical protein
MKTTEFIQKYSPCDEGAEFAQQFETMAEVWEACKRPGWLFWILEKHAPLEKRQSVRLAIHFAEAAIGNWKDKADQRPALAIQAAKTWLENPTEENQAAAKAAADAVDAAMAEAWAADAAAWAAVWAANAAAEAAWAAALAAAEEAAEEAAWAAGRAAEAAKAAECDIIRQFIPNPF